MGETDVCASTKFHATSKPFANDTHQKKFGWNLMTLEEHRELQYPLPLMTPT
jgi:hypothetical protein